MRCFAPVVFTVFATGFAFSSPEKSEEIRFNEWFYDKTLRLDLIHIGTDVSEGYALINEKEEVFWGGRYFCLDRFPDYGKHRISVYDLETGKLIFRQGYSSLFSEWQTTDEAKTKQVRAFEEVIRLPFPKKKVKVVISSRNRNGNFTEIFSISVDPESLLIDKTKTKTDIQVIDINVPQPADRCLDIVIVGDGYTREEGEKFEADARRFADVLFETDPFISFVDRICIRAIKPLSKESGTTDPRRGIFRDTPIRTTLNTFNSARYLTTRNLRELHDICANAPYDTIIVMVNSSQYGGGGIFGFYAVFVSDNEYDEYIFTHEFGHSFGGLADEYYTSSVSYNDFYPRGIEPWEPNITAWLKGRHIKWAEVITPGVPLPTPEDETRYSNVVGLFEGAGYSAKGLFRPSLDCKMFSKSNKGFCAVCKTALLYMLKVYTLTGC